MSKYNAVGLNAVHCAISSADAMLVFYAGIRSASEHISVVELLMNSVRLPDMKAGMSENRDKFENQGPNKLQYLTALILMPKRGF